MDFEQLSNNAITRAYNQLNTYRVILPGNNGPYREVETPTRNCSHFYILTSKFRNFNSEAKIVNENLEEYLFSDFKKFISDGYFARFPTNKDRHNGVIGISWFLEAYFLHCEQSQKLPLKDLQEIDGLLNDYEWKNLRTSCAFENKKLKLVDVTPNHIIYLLYIKLYLKKLLKRDCSEIEMQIDKTINNLTIYKNGIINIGFVSGSKFKNLVKTIYYKIQKRSIYNKSVGYHVFTLWILSRIFQLLNKKLDKRLPAKSFDILYTKEFYQDLEHNIYGYFYNPPGIEIPNLSTYVDIASAPVKRILERQIQVYSNISNELRVHDKNTLLARLYENYI
ncbi:hypothetical protein N8668_00810 [bacterium]|nr:hypothetical protein [bacterium]MDA7660292.1 hypothetical protein [Verrucomicrobiota bacterium]